VTTDESGITDEVIVELSTEEPDQSDEDSTDDRSGG
jgi:hypothetical protein